MERPINLRVLLSHHEKHMVDALALRDGLTVADTVRQLIRRGFDQAGICLGCGAKTDLATLTAFGNHCPKCAEATRSESEQLEAEEEGEA